MIDITNPDLIKGAISALFVFIAFHYGRIYEMDSLKTKFSSIGLGNGYPHFSVLIGRIGIFENPMIQDEDLGAFSFPDIEVIEIWKRIIGPIWWKSVCRDMTMLEIQEYRTHVFNQQLQIHNRINKLNANKSMDSSEQDLQAKS
jgi:hypothetical protein